MKYSLVLLLFATCLLKAQDYPKIDSLKQILKTLPELNGTDADTTRMKVCINIAKLYEKTIPDSALYWYASVSDTIVDNERISQYKGRAESVTDALYCTGLIYYYMKNYLLAGQYWLITLRFREELDNKPGISACLNNLGLIASSQCKYSESISFYERSLKIDEELGDKAGMSKCLNNLGNVARSQGNCTEAVLFFERSLKIKEELGDKAGISACLNNLGIVARNQGNYIEAASFYERSLKIKEELGDKEGISGCLNNLGIVAKYQGRYSDAVLFYMRSLKIDEDLGDKAGMSKCLNNLGIVAESQGNYSEAVSFYERSLKIKEEIGDKTGISTCLNNLGIIAKYQGRYSDAVSFYERSLNIDEELGDKAGVSKCLNNLGNVAEAQGNYSDAVYFYGRSLKIAEETGDKEGISRCLNNLGIIAENQGNFSGAASFYNRSLKIAEEMGDKEGISRCFNNLGSVEESQGNYNDAVSLYERSLKIKEEIGDKANLAMNYPNLAKVYIKTGKTYLAPMLLKKSLDLTLWLLKDNFCILSEQEKELYLEKTKNIFNEIHSFTLNEPVYRDSISGTCFNNELILKGLLLKSTAGILDVVYNSPDPELKKTFFLLKEYRDRISSLQGTEEANRDSLISDLEKKANEQERKLIKMSSEFADIQNLFSYKWQDVQKKLQPGEAAIEFIHFRNSSSDSSGQDAVVYAALLITPDCKLPKTIRLFEESELQAIIGKTTGTGYNYVNSLYGVNSTALYDLIWKPLEPVLSGINTVYFAPVGVLNKISFAALSKEPGKMLCGIYNLQQVSTTGKLIKREVKPGLIMIAAVFGGINYNPDSVIIESWKYLPGTMNEINGIEKQFKKNKVVFVAFSGKDAKEESFKALFDKSDAPSILHVSTHGFFYPEPSVQNGKQSESEDGGIEFRGSSGFGNWMFVNNKNPMMRSGLVFAGANRVWSEDWGRTDNEGVLTAYEVSNLNMRNTDLVVLSACETGLGDIKGSEGVYGLQRAFKMAGVKYIIMSLWQVPDKETVEFMDTFYKKLLKEKDVRQAFNETQKEMRKKYDAYYWGAFVLIE